MSEGVEEQQPSPIEQVKPPVLRQETAQNQIVEIPHPDEALGKLEKGDVIGYMDMENKKYLRENAETPEQAEQLVQIYENAKKLQETVTNFSEDNPDIPASEETKQKLNSLDKVDSSVDSGLRHEFATATFLLPTVGAAAFEMFNLASGGTIATPGFPIEVGLAIGAAMGGSIEGYALVKKGAEKLKALIRKNKPTGAETPQSQRIQTEEVKAA